MIGVDGSAAHTGPRGGGFASYEGLLSSRMSYGSNSSSESTLSQHGHNGVLDVK